MDLLQPRSAYRRANSEEPLALADYNLELTSVRSIQSFTSSKVDQAPLLEYGREYHVPEQRPSSFFERLGSTVHQLVPQQLYGWKLGALGAGILAAVSLLINIVAAAWLGSHKQGTGLVELYTGDCKVVTRMDIWVHLAINAISTLLLGGSNYCMQCLCAPTRADVDRAHQQYKFVDIGVPSLRNLSNIPRFKSILWWTLALSSIPLHLMYNSAFYKSLSTNDYDVIIATEAFVDGTLRYNQTWDLSEIVNLTAVQHNISTSDRYERMEKSDCMKAYATNFLSQRRNLVLVSHVANETRNDTVLNAYRYQYDAVNFDAVNYYSDLFPLTYGANDPYSWICVSDPDMSSRFPIPYDSQNNPRPCSTYVSQVIKFADSWKPYGYNVTYCLSERVPQTCSFSGNIPIVAVVIVCNFIKMIGMFIVAFRLGPGSLITIGDAIASFLAQPDPETKGRCLLSRPDVVEQMRQKRLYPSMGKPLPPAPKTARIRRSKWWSSVSFTRWFVTFGLLIVALIISSVLLNMAVKAISNFGLPPLSLPFGAVDPAAIVTGWGASSGKSPSSRILTSILVANLPQTIFSFLYLNLNGLLTTMWVADEWSDFATQRKPLRTSKPRGGQRSKHFLQLPYRISLPLMLVSGLMHWLISQSVFLAVVAEYSSRGLLDSPVSIASCGFSPVAIIVVIVLGAVIIIATFALGLRSYDGSIPMVGSCSLAISAACHRPEWDTNAAMKPVLWGVIPGTGGSSGDREVEHCSFTSGEVEPLQDGKVYAGSLKVD